LLDLRKAASSSCQRSALTCVRALTSSLPTPSTLASRYGIKSFYVPRSKPDGFSVNVRCLDGGGVRITRITLFDGEHWEEQMAKLGRENH